MMVVGGIVIILMMAGFVSLFMGLLFKGSPLARNLFIGLGLLTIGTPLLLFGLSDLSGWLNVRNFRGQYIDAGTGSQLTLLDDNVWTSDIQNLKCSRGNWEYVSTEGFDVIVLTGACESGNVRVEVLRPAAEKMTLNFESLSGNLMTLNKKKN